MANIYVTAVKVPVSRAQTRHGRDGFADLVPWADPYIVGLVESLQRGDGRLPPVVREKRQPGGLTSAVVKDELPGPGAGNQRFERPSGGRF